jgi:UPF0271 protein
MEVLDASAFIHDREPDGRVATVPAVHAELEGASAYRFDAMAGAGMTVHVPDAPTVERVERAAEATGDAGALSNADARLLAAAVELDARLVTDDYAMQNVAGRLGVPVETIAREGIAEERDWGFQCAGCGREFEERAERCPVCGSALSRKNPSGA